MTQIRSTRTTAVLCAFTLIIAQGCEPSPTEPPPPGAIFQTTQAVYEIPAPPASRVAIDLRVTNPTRGTFFLYESGLALNHVQMKVGDTWVNLHPLLTLGPPNWPEFGVEPGESRGYSININVDRDPSSIFGVDGPGVYRAVFIVGRGAGHSSFNAISNEFELRLAQ